MTGAGQNISNTQAHTGERTARERSARGRKLRSQRNILDFLIDRHTHAHTCTC